MFDGIFRQQPNIRLEELTSPDISRYVQGRFATEMDNDLNLESAAGDMHRLQQRIVENAAGVFLWVKLVVNILVDGSSEFDSVDEFREKLIRLPTELGGPNGLYMQMLRDVKQEHRGQCVFSVDAVLAAVRPLTSAVLCFAYNARDKAFEYVRDIEMNLYSSDQLKTLQRQLEGRLRIRCGGILECRSTNSSDPLLGINQLIGRMNTYPAEHELPETSRAIEVYPIHLSLLEFLRQQYAQDFLDAMRGLLPAGSSTDLCIMKGFIIALKLVPTDTLEIWRWIRTSLHHCRLANDSDRDTDTLVVLLDELDRTLDWCFRKFTHPFTTADEGQQDLREEQHWYLTEPQASSQRDVSERSDIACVAVMWSLSLYVSSKLQSRAITLEKEGR